MANEAFRILATLADRIIAVEGRMRNLEFLYWQNHMAGSDIEADSLNP